MKGAKNLDIKKFKHEALSEKIKQLLNLHDEFHHVHVIFGGTGAVGGQGLIELVELYEYMIRIKGPEKLHRPRIVATGYSRKEIDAFVDKIKALFGKVRKAGHGFSEINVEGSKAEVILARKSGVIVEFYLFDASPQLNIDLNEVVSETATTEDNVEALRQAVSKLDRPFTNFIEQNILINDLGGQKVRSVISGIPIPSVAAYRMADVDKALRAISAKTVENERIVKREVLEIMATDFGNIKAHLSEEVLIAHTTSVGGMYVIEDGEQVIKIGFAHSSSGELLKEKQFYASVLTEAYSALGIKSLITAAAIGIDNIRYNQKLPMGGEVFKKFAARKEEGTLPFDGKLIDRSGGRFNYHFDAMTGPAPGQGKTVKGKALKFLKKRDARELEVKYAIKSGENGWFSLDNTWALYLNMKVATQEELAHVLVFNALFGDDRQMPFFDEDGICYYTQTDNSSLAFALLGNSEPFRRYQTSGFSPKAYQDLGSNKHQGALHTIGLYMLLHRLKALNPVEISRIRSKYSLEETIEYVDRNTPALLIEDVVEWGPRNTSSDFASLLQTDNIDWLRDFIGYRGDWTPFVKHFFRNLLTAIQDAYQTVTSLGTPIIFRPSDGPDQILYGPYLAPVDLVVTHTDSISKEILGIAKHHKVDPHLLFDWFIANNGFVDLRPEATVVTARSISDISPETVRKCTSLIEFREMITSLEAGQYFATSGTLAFVGRMQGLYEQLNSYDVRFGTYNAWKALFPIDENNNHPIIPGIVEAMRLYSEGLGKVTGTEMLYPMHGYFMNLE